MPENNDWPEIRIKSSHLINTNYAEIYLTASTSRLQTLQLGGTIQYCRAYQFAKSHAFPPQQPSSLIEANTDSSLESKEPKLATAAKN